MIEPKAANKERLQQRKAGCRLSGFAVLLTLACAVCFICGAAMGFWLLDRQQQGPGHRTRLPLPTNEYINKVTIAVQKSLDNLEALRASRKEGTCSDTCITARNGKCEDGRNALTVEVSQRLLCDPGTDCSDCGHFHGPPSTTVVDHMTPVAYATSIGMAMFVRKTTTRPEFIAVHADPKLDMDVSTHLERDGMIESGITGIFYKVLSGNCIRPDGSRALVLDVGANFGYFTLYAAKMGCRVVAWEPVPRFRAFIKYALQINNLTHLVELREHVAGEREEEVEMSVPLIGNWGTASVAGINQYEKDAELVKVTSERVDRVVKEDALLMKVDVEGYESIVFRGTQDLLLHYTIENIVLEYTPAVAERMASSKHDNTLMEENPKRLVVMLLQGYTMVQMNDNVAKGTAIMNWDDPIQALPEVTVAHLKYDIADTERFAKRELGCPIPMELKQFEGWKGPCNQLGDFHPKSLRSMFPYNTNLWASKKTSIMKKMGYVGIFDMGQDAINTWTSQKDPEHGVASFSCPHLEPHMLVRYRCNCSWMAKEAGDVAMEQCKREQDTVMRLIREKRMPIYDQS